MAQNFLIQHIILLVKVLFSQIFWNLDLVFVHSEFGTIYRALVRVFLASQFIHAIEVAYRTRRGVVTAVG